MYWLKPSYWFASKHQKQKIAILAKYTGKEQEYQLLELSYNSGSSKITQKDYRLAKFDIALKYNEITPKDYDSDRLYIAFTHGEISQKDYDLAKLDIALKYNDITQVEYKKQTATINGVPWVGCLDDSFDPSQGESGYYFHLDWNSLFIDLLKNEGYTGLNDDAIVEQWFNAITTKVIDEME